MICDNKYRVWATPTLNYSLFTIHYSLKKAESENSALILKLFFFCLFFLLLVEENLVNGEIEEELNC